MKNKTLIYGILVIAILVSIPLAGTVAYLSYQTNQKDNPFLLVGTGKEQGIYAVITEPNWDGMIINPNYVSSPDRTGELVFDAGTYTSPDNPSLGMNMAKKVMPGMEIPKSPALTNKSKTDAVWTSTPIFAAVKITFIKGQDPNGTPMSVEEYKANFMKSNGTDPLIELAGLTAGNGWVADENNTTVSRIYYWATGTSTAGTAPTFTQLAQDVATAPLFTSVKVSKDLTSDIANTICEWNGFNIKIEGAICQAEHISSEDAKMELKGLLTPMP